MSRGGLVTYHVTVGTSTTVSLMADGVDFPMANRKFSIVTARLHRV